MEVTGLAPDGFEGVVVRLHGLDDGSLDAEIRSLETAMRRTQAELSAAIAVADARGLYGTDGHRSMAGYLRAAMNWSGGEVARQRKLARALDRLPGAGDAVLSGRVGVPQAQVLAAAAANPRAGDAVRDAVGLLLDQAEHLPFDDFRICVDRFVMLADLDGAFDDAEADRERRTARVTAIDGTIDVAASGGDPLVAATMMGVFEQFVQAEFHHDCRRRRDEHGDAAHTHPLPRTAAQRRFDALAAIFTTAASTPAGGLPPEPVVDIVIDEQTFTHAFRTAGLLPTSHGTVDLTDLTAAESRDLLEQLTDAGGTDVGARSLVDRRCETTSGVVVHPKLVVQAALGGWVRRVVVDAKGVIIDHGRRQRLFTGAARTAALLLHRTCAHPGCTIPADRCDVDHLDEWERHHGPTDQTNAGPACGVHDRFKHRQRWRVRRDVRGRLRFLRPDGTIVLPVGERTPEFDDGPNAA